MSVSKLVFKSDTASAQGGIKGIESSLKGLKSVASGIGTAFKSAMIPIAALAALGGGFGMGIKGIIDLGGELQDLSGITDIAVKDLVILQEQFRQAGVPVEGLEKTLAIMSKKLDQPSAQVQKWLKLWKISAEEIKGLGIAERFELIGSKIGGLSSATEKLTAAQTFFSKGVGISLINLFKASDGYAQAKEYVGGLADIMEQTAPRLEAVGDRFDGIKKKIQGFFAGVIVDNIAPLEKLGEAIQKLDLTNAGKGFGKIIAQLTNAFNNGQMWEAIKNGFLYALATVKSYLVAACIYAGTQMGIAINDAIANTDAGKKWGVKRYNEQTVTKDNGKPPFIGYMGSLIPNPDFKSWEETSSIKKLKTFNDILGEQLESSGAESYKDKFIKAGKEDPLAKYKDPEYKKDFMKEFSDEWKKNIPLKLPANFKDNYGPRAQDAKLEKIKPEYELAAYKPAVQSLMAIGGAKSQMQKNPLIGLQNKANELLLKIANNTKKKTVSMWSK